MDATAVKGFFDGLQNFAIATAAVAALCGWLVGRKVEREKEAKEQARQEQELADRKELLDRAKTAEEGFTRLQGDTKALREWLEKRYPGTDPTEALARLRRDVEGVREIALRDDYRPLTGDARARVIRNLATASTLAKQRDIVVAVYVKAHAHHDGRSRLVDEIRDLLAEGGVPASVGAPISMVGGTLRHAVSLCFRVSYQDVAEAISAALQPVLGGPVPALRDDNVCPEGQILLQVTGTPAFAQDGTVTFR